MQYFDYIVAVWLFCFCFLANVAGRGFAFVIGMLFFKLFPLLAGITLIIRAVR